MNYNRQLFKEAFKAGYLRALRESKEYIILKSVVIPISIKFRKFSNEKRTKCFVTATFLYKYSKIYPITLKRLAKDFSYKDLEGYEADVFLTRIQEHIEGKVITKNPDFISSREFLELDYHDVVDFEGFIPQIKEIIFDGMKKMSGEPMIWGDKNEALPETRKYDVVLYQTRRDEYNRYEFGKIIDLSKPNENEEKQLMLKL